MGWFKQKPEVPAPPRVFKNIETLVKKGEYWEVYVVEDDQLVEHNTWALSEYTTIYVDAKDKAWMKVYERRSPHGSWLATHIDVHVKSPSDIIHAARSSSGQSTGPWI
jgi:hypothetical protein